MLYCSLCDGLRSQFGLAGAVFINHELTLALLAFAPSIAENTFAVNHTRCPARLWTLRKQVQSSVLIEQAAKYSLILGWLKATDWKTDQPGWFIAQLHRLLMEKVMPALQSLPLETFRLIDSYLMMITQPISDFTHLQYMSGQLAAHFGEKLGEHADIPSVDLQAYLPLFNGVGELVLEADHLLDFQKDQKKNQYNPICSRMQIEKLPAAEAYYSFWSVAKAHIQNLYKELSLLDVIASSTFIKVSRLSLERLEARLECACLSMTGIEPSQLAVKKNENSPASGKQDKTHRKDHCTDYCDGCNCCSGDCCHCLTNCSNCSGPHGCNGPSNCDCDGSCCDCSGCCNP